MKQRAAWLIYGANGYTGRLVAEEAVRRKMHPVLGGRSAAPINRMGRELGCETRVMSLDDPNLASMLEPFGCVLLIAGPFSRTRRPMLEACMKAGCHYLDLSGELDIIEACYAEHDAAIAAGIAVVPAVGFNVVPMDCLAAKLATAEGRPVGLELGFEGYELSAGTAKTYAEGIAKGNARRKGGRIERSPLAWELVPIPFKKGIQHALRVPYGELASCHRATGIANINVFMVPPPSLRLVLQHGPRFATLLRFERVKRAVDFWAERRFPGPDEITRRTKRTQVWGKVVGGDGRERQGFVETPEPYQLTVATALAAVERVLSGTVSPGAWAPSQAFGSDFLATVGGCTMEIDDVATRVA